MTDYKKQIRNMFICVAVLSAVIGVVIVRVDSYFDFLTVPIIIPTVLFVTTAVIVGFTFLIWAISNKLFSQGFIYACKLSKIKRRFNKELKRSEFRQDLSANKNAVYYPLRVKFKLDKNFCGEIHIQNVPKFEAKLDTLDYSSCLPKNLIISNKYRSDNRNIWILEVEDFSLNQIEINNVEDLAKLCDKTSRYKLTITDKVKVPIHHTLMVGQTGSGKSYALFTLILQMLYKGYALYICDSKASSIGNAGFQICADRSATSAEDITNLIIKFDDILEERKNHFSELLGDESLGDGLDVDYRNYELPPAVLIVDEFSAYIATLDKPNRDKVMSVLTRIVLMGRQLGVFLFIAQQQTNAKNLPTELRENIPLKIILGKSGKETYVTALGLQPDAVKRKFKAGEGVLVYPNISTEENPLVMAMPKLSDSLFSVSGIKDVIRQASVNGAPGM